ncbi:THO Complex (transcription factor/nuclear export) subunit family member protein [Reticulomyxa filosa]|uniref:THO Complex (Transcription factor/nuclear export) subunit family member protein n=1 Tax=Reticulomyxa filosa TaxID=46433 RepID=X6PFP6_RETFI|nr:THO Complex (transcription factor/nuclear export) subunit family member protein [Reticulomyxa filosa]|eukprot:ETO37046.1 THO Complex (transcription factor/nuclear export) subunit family member protein [Reticulomyxa filosa]
MYIFIFHHRIEICLSVYLSGSESEANESDNESQISVPRANDDEVDTHKSENSVSSIQTKPKENGTEDERPKHAHLQSGNQNEKSKKENELADDKKRMNGKHKKENEKHATESDDRQKKKIETERGTEIKRMKDRKGHGKSKDRDKDKNKEKIKIKIRLETKETEAKIEKKAKNAVGQNHDPKVHVNSLIILNGCATINDTLSNIFSFSFVYFVAFLKINDPISKKPKFFYNNEIQGKCTILSFFLLFFVKNILAREEKSDYIIIAKLIELYSKKSYINFNSFYYLLF